MVPVCGCGGNQGIESGLCGFAVGFGEDSNGTLRGRRREFVVSRCVEVSVRR